MTRMYKLHLTLTTAALLGAFRAQHELRLAAIHAFRRRYLELDRQRQASVLLTLIDRAGLSASALASALKQLAAPREDLSVLCEQPETPGREPRRPAVS